MTIGQGSSGRRTSLASLRTIATPWTPYAVFEVDDLELHHGRAIEIDGGALAVGVKQRGVAAPRSIVVVLDLHRPIEAA